MNQSERSVVVIGAGITGLTAAYQLQKRHPEFDVTVLEAADRPGGKILTTAFAGMQVDEAADMFLARVPWAIELAEELGLRDELVSPAQRSAYIYSYGKLCPVPQPMVLGVPLDLDTLAESGVLSAAGVAAAAADLDRTENEVVGDESIGSIVRRRLGDEVLERLVDPLLGGINAGDCDSLSLDASAAQLAHAARQGASFIGELRLIREQNPPNPHAPLFFAHPDGMGRFIDELSARLGSRIVTNTSVESLEREGSSWRLLTGDGVFDADAIVLAIPASRAASLVQDLAPVAAAEMRSIEFASVAMVVLAFDPSDIALELDGAGVLVPKPEQHAITACSWGSSKWAHLGASGYTILRVSVGHIGNPEVARLPDDELLATIGADLKRIMGIDAAPAKVRISRWLDSFPQYSPGHLAKVNTIEESLEECAPGLFIAGASYRGLGIPACIDQAHQAVKSTERLLLAQ